MRRLATVLAAAGALASGATRGQDPSPTLVFTDVTALSGIDYRNVCGALPRDKGYMTETIGAGAAWLDFDGDGKLDLYVINGSTHDRRAGQGEPNRLYRGDGRGRFVEVGGPAGVGDRGWGYGAAVGDIDNDGDPDLYVTNLGPNVLYLNRGDGTFRDATAQAGVGDGSWGTSAALFDIEPDGDLDLYVANYVDFRLGEVPRYGSPEAARRTTCTFQGLAVFCGPMGLRPAQDVLYRNAGNGTFTDVTRQAGLAVDPPRYALGVVTGDYDNDGDSDVYVANDSVQNSLWMNLGNGTFQDVGVRTLTALSGAGQPQAGMGTDFGDYNGDGFLDLVVTNFSHDLNTIYRNVSGKFFVDDSLSVGMGVTQMALSWGTAFYDFDLDGDLDLFIANGHTYPHVDDYNIGTRFKQRNHVFLNESGRLVEVSERSGPGLAIERSFRGAAFADYDDDGDVDVFVVALDEAPLLLRNDTPRRGHYLMVRLVGRESNRDGVGARVIVTAGGRRQIRERKGGGSYLSQSDPRLHFGLGTATIVDAVHVRWPSGRQDALREMAADQVLTITEGQTSGR